MQKQATHEPQMGPLMASPAVLCLICFVAMPFLLAIVLSFTNLKLGSPLPLEFVGLEQFRRIFADDSFRRALLNNGIFALVVVPTQTSVALVLALALNQRIRGMVIFRALFFLPVVFPLSLVSVVWVLMFAPGPNGFLNGLLGALTLGEWVPKDFLRDPMLALPSIMVTSVWQGAGFQVVLLLAGLQAISHELYEAAQIDGAGPWQRFLHITVPQLSNTLTFVVVVTTILSFRLFDQVRIMTKGGPLDATTTVMFEAVRAAFDRQQLARGTAMTVVLFSVVLLVIGAGRRWSRSRGAEW